MLSLLDHAEMQYKSRFLLSLTPEESDGPSGNRRTRTTKDLKRRMWKHYSSDLNSRLYQKISQKRKTKEDWRRKLNKRENG